MNDLQLTFIWIEAKPCGSVCVYSSIAHHRNGQQNACASHLLYLSRPEAARYWQYCPVTVRFCSTNDSTTCPEAAFHKCSHSSESLLSNIAPWSVFLATARSDCDAISNVEKHALEWKMPWALPVPLNENRNVYVPIRSIDALDIFTPASFLCHAPLVTTLPSTDHYSSP